MSVSEFWEPWTLEVGQRVRVRLSPECLYCEGDLPELAAKTGDTGVVFSTQAFIHDRDGVSHHYWVTLDDRSDGTHISHFAAIELEPLGVA